MNEAWEQAITEPDERSVFAAVANPKWDFRTVDGIAKETRLDSSRVEAILGKHSQFVRRSAVPSRNGADLYTLKKRTLREALSVMRGAISKSS